MLSMDAKKILCTACWNRVMPSSTNTKSEPTKPKSHISTSLDLPWFIDKVMANGDKSVSIYIRNDDMQISVYPYPEQEEQTNE